uniref:Uncharacterized protein n=1 Tax=Avena sativa TaxID=4498 RepID=A0ACD5W600_AVESA
MPSRKLVLVLFLCFLAIFPSCLLGDAAEGDVLPPDELALEVLALLEDITRTRLCTPACMTCLVQIGMSCPLMPAIVFAPCALTHDHQRRLLRQEVKLCFAC